jgi:hypothetical protein
LQFSASNQNWPELHLPVPLKRGEKKELRWDSICIYDPLLTCLSL